jgi:hypothetical protein
MFTDTEEVTKKGEKLSEAGPVDLTWRVEQMELKLDKILTNPKFYGVIHLPVLTAVPTKGSIGDMVFVGTKLYVCTAANTFTVVGTQT